LRVAIANSSSNRFWYKNSIGKVFEVVDTEFKMNNEVWYKLATEKTKIAVVLKKDVINADELSSNVDSELQDELETRIIVKRKFDDDKQKRGEIELESSVYDVSDELFLDYLDTLNSKASIKHKQGILKIRVYNKQIITDLKKRYDYTCQICKYSSKKYNAHIVEAHHLEEFSLTQKNTHQNIMIVCPNHHRLIHSAHGNIDLKTRTITYENGHKEKIHTIGHLSGGIDRERIKATL
jgi:hypothetical protein